MTTRFLCGTAAAVLFSLAACQSVHTQNDPEVITNPAATTAPALSLTADPALTISLDPTPTPTPVATPTATPTPRPTKHAYNSVETSRKVVAITFDDGPHKTLTPKLLDILKERNVKATFYVVGTNVELYPEIVQRMIAEGHEVGNHTWNHPALTKLGAAGVKSQMDRTTAAIVKAIGEKPKTMRPPYGATNASLNKRLDTEYGFKVIMWSVDPLDWKYRNASRVTQEVVKGAAPGAIILAHDIHASTVNAMPSAIDQILAKGYEFATVSELLAMEGADDPAPAAPVVSSPEVQETSLPTAPAIPAATPFTVERQ